MRKTDESKLTINEGQEDAKPRGKKTGKVEGKKTRIINHRKGRKEGGREEGGIARY